MKDTRESSGDQIVSITLVPKGSWPTRRSAADSIRFKTKVSWYKKAKKTIAQAPKPARCHLRGLMQLIRQSPNMAVMDVKREASNPIQPPVMEGRKFSGKKATAIIAIK